jgi:hypothetical protein
LITRRYRTVGANEGKFRRFDECEVSVITIEVGRTYMLFDLDQLVPSLLSVERVRRNAAEKDREEKEALKPNGICKVDGGRSCHHP